MDTLHHQAQLAETHLPHLLGPPTQLLQRHHFRKMHTGMHRILNLLHFKREQNWRTKPIHGEEQVNLKTIARIQLRVWGVRANNVRKVNRKV